jgi:hypothetical protein
VAQLAKLNSIVKFVRIVDHVVEEIIKIEVPEGGGQVEAGLVVELLLLLM